MPEQERKTNSRQGTTRQGKERKKYADEVSTGGGARRNLGESKREGYEIPDPETLLEAWNTPDDASRHEVDYPSHMRLGYMLKRQLKPDINFSLIDQCLLSQYRTLTIKC